MREEEKMIMTLYDFTIKEVQTSGVGGGGKQTFDVSFC